jgi:Tfp pilus assembly protein PilZ
MFWKKRKKKGRGAGLDRRREPRREDECTITLTRRDSTDHRGAKTIYYGRTKNASPSGLKIDSDVSFPVGTIVSIKLQSPKTRRLIQATGEVKWVTPIGEGQSFEIGLEFVETSVGSIMDLLDHIYKA